MKKALLILAFAVVFVLTACSSSQEPQYYPEERVFDEPQALSAYINEIFDKPKDIPLFAIALNIPTAELHDIKLIGNNIYYRYLLDGSTTPNDTNTFSVGWNYTGNGKEGLEYFVTSNASVVSLVEGYDGLYSSDGTDLDGKVVGKMLYWVQDDCQFSASVPNEILDEVIASIYSNTPLATKIS